MWEKDASGEWSFELQPEDWRRFKANDAITETVSQGCTEEVFRKLACVRCGGPLSLNVHPNGEVYYLYCSGHLAHFGVHGRFETRLSWQKKYIRFNWLDDA